MRREDTMIHDDDDTPRRTVKRKQVATMTMVESRPKRHIYHNIIAIFMLLGHVSHSYALLIWPATRSSSPWKILNNNNNYPVKNNVAPHRPTALVHTNILSKNLSKMAALSIGMNSDDDFPIENNKNNDLVENENLNAPLSVQVEKLKKKSSPSFPLVLWRFTRPHTIIGSAIAIPSIFLLAAPTFQSFFTQRAMSSLIYAVIPSLFMNLYITGLNQITDVEIDKINKPELPIAKGDLSYSTACIVVLVALVVSLAMSIIHPIFSSGGLQLALWGSCLLGTLYSLPPFRMKKHPLLAAFCIVAVRGTIINAGFYSHAAATAFHSKHQFSGVLSCLLQDWKCAFSSIFYAIFGIVIALMKDVPDIRGDRTFNIRSFTVRLGQTRVFGLAKNLLALLFVVAGGTLIKWTVMAPAALSVSVRRGAIGLCSWAAGWWVNKAASAVDAEDSEDVYNYYMKLWNLFYLSYVALPFIS